MNSESDTEAAGAGERRTPGSGSSRKVLQILFAFSEQRLEATVAELAEIIGSPAPTVYRYVALLKEMQLLEEGRAGSYHPTARVMPLARAAQLSNDMARIAGPLVAEASERLGETVMLMQHLGDAVVCIERTECDRPMRYTFQRGHSIPLGTGASGKMALASLPAARRAKRLDELNASDELRREVDQALAERFSTSESELDQGVWACSVPVTEGAVRPVVLTVAGPVARFNDHSREQILQVLRDSAAQIGAQYARYAI